MHHAPAHHVRLMLGQPGPFRSDRLSGEWQTEDSLRSRELRQSAIVAVEDGRPQRMTLCIDKTQAWGQPAHADRGDAGRIDTGCSE